MHSVKPSSLAILPGSQAMHYTPSLLYVPTEHFVHLGGPPFFGFEAGNSPPLQLRVHFVSS